MAQTRKLIPLIDNIMAYNAGPAYAFATMSPYYSAERAERHDVFQGGLKGAYQFGASIINRLPLLLDLYWALPDIETVNGSRPKGKNPLQFCFIIKTFLDAVQPEYIYAEALRRFKDTVKFTVGQARPSFPNGSELLSDIAYYDLLYFYIHANSALFKGADLSQIRDTGFSRGFLSVFGQHNVNDKLFRDALDKVLIRGQSTIEAYQELAQLVYPTQMANKKVAQTQLGQHFFSNSSRALTAGEDQEAKSMVTKHSL